VSVAAPARAPDAPPPAAASARRRGRSRGPRDFDRPRFLLAFTALFYALLFVPIAVVVLFSFNAERSLQEFGGVSLRWYDAFLSSESYRSSLVASIEIALGTMLAFGLVRSRSRRAGRSTC
jgi:spermidine/putrescine transport system permease protein